MKARIITQAEVKAVAKTARGRWFTCDTCGAGYGIGVLVDLIRNGGCFYCVKPKTTLAKKVKLAAAEGP